MSRHKSKPRSKPPPIAVCAPPAQRADFLATNCTTALLFPASAPLASKSNTCQVIAATHAQVTQLDLQATWAYVHAGEGKATTALVFLHGHYGYVTIDSDANSATPDWAAKAFAKPGGLATPIGYKVAATADAYKGGTIVAVVPEIAKPNAVPATNSTEEAGTLDGKDPGVLGKLLDECFDRLSKVKNGKCPGPPLKAGLKSANLSRLFLSGHSGGHKALFPSATSQLVRTVPTDLIMLDCFYGDGTKQVTDFWNNAKGGIGMGAGQSRIFMVWNRGSYGPPMTDPDAYSIPMMNMLRRRFKKEFVLIDGGGVREARKALAKAPVVAVRTDVDHFSIPHAFTPLLLDPTPGASASP